MSRFTVSELEGYPITTTGGFGHRELDVHVWDTLFRPPRLVGFKRGYSRVMRSDSRNPRVSFDGARAAMRTLADSLNRGEQAKR